VHSTSQQHLKGYELRERIGAADDGKAGYSPASASLQNIYDEQIENIGRRLEQVNQLLFQTVYELSREDDAARLLAFDQYATM
jgi:hypothetical protein